MSFRCCIFLVVIFTSLATPAGAQRIISPDRKSLVADLLYERGVNCDQVVSISPMGPNEYGNLFLVTCLAEGSGIRRALLYDVVETVKGKIYVRPAKLPTR